MPRARARALLFQQQSIQHDHQLPTQWPVAIGDPWQWWTPQYIALVSQAPVANVLQVWPLLYASLEQYGIADYNTCRAAIATVAIETAHTFLPVREAYWLDDRYGYEWAEEWRRTNLRYWPYYGRGLIQITWQSNYAWYGSTIGHPEIESYPDKALLIEIACPIFASYFRDRGVYIAAIRGDWREVRRLVQGADAGLDELIIAVDALAANSDALAA